MLCCCQLALATDVFAITETSSQLNARDSFLGAQEFLFGGTGTPFLEDTLFLDAKTLWPLLAIRLV